MYDVVLLELKLVDLQGTSSDVLDWKCTSAIFISAHFPAVINPNP